MEAKFTWNGVTYTGDLDANGTGTLFGSRPREAGDAYLSGSHRTATTTVSVEQFEAVEHGDKRYVLGRVEITNDAAK